jgi:hypothetical protein
MTAIPTPGPGTNAAISNTPTILPHPAFNIRALFKFPKLNNARTECSDLVIPQHLCCSFNPYIRADRFPIFVKKISASGDLEAIRRQCYTEEEAAAANLYARRRYGISASEFLVPSESVESLTDLPGTR